MYNFTLQKESGHTCEIRAKPEYHKFLIGRGGSNIRKVRENTGARVIFPTSSDADRELITIMGKKESAEQAKAHIEELIKDLVCIFKCSWKALTLNWNLLIIYCIQVAHLLWIGVHDIMHKGM